MAIADLDPQGSSLDWLEARRDYTGIPGIQGIDGAREAVRVAPGTDFLVMDAPAGTHGPEIGALLRRVQTLVMPVLPSPIDMRAARRFLEELLGTGRISRGSTRIGIVANRVREHTVVYHHLEEFLGHLDLPVVDGHRQHAANLPVSWPPDTISTAFSGQTCRQLSHRVHRCMSTACLR